MAFLGISVPREIRQLLSDVEVPGDPVGKGSHHITLVYFGDKIPIGEVCKAIEAIAPVFQSTAPFPVAVAEVDSFPENPDWKPGQVPVIGKVRSDELHELRGKLAEALDAAGAAFSKKFPDYNPHVTLSYAPVGGGEQPPKFELEQPITWTVAEAVLWAGDEEDDRFVVRFALPRLGARYESAEGKLEAMTVEKLEEDLGKLLRA